MERIVWWYWEENKVTVIARTFLYALWLGCLKLSNKEE